MKNKESSASKIVLDSYESLFGDQEDTGKEDRVKMIPIAELYEFAGHPFRVLDDEKMQETVESVKKYGVLVPGIARKRPQDSGGGYEIISGHRRRRACELAGLTEMPMFVRDYSDDEAVVVMVDSNIQREDILPSEKARAYRMKYDALRHQGVRGEKNTADAVGESAGDSGTTTPPPECSVPEYPFPSLEEQRNTDGSVYNYYRQAIAIRNAIAAIARGRVTAETGLNTGCVSAQRKTWNDQQCIILMNIATEAATVDLTGYADWSLAASLCTGEEAVSQTETGLTLPAYGIAILTK